MPDESAHVPIAPAARMITGVFGLTFAGIGLAVLGFMWFSPRDDFGSPPLFFRIFASFIALPFVAVGGTAVYGAVTGRSRRQRQVRIPAGSQGAAPVSAPTPSSGYQCPRCGAPLGTNADVSPSGDVKCGFCNTWFNIHRRTA